MCSPDLASLAGAAFLWVIVLSLGGGFALLLYWAYLELRRNYK